MAQLTKALVQVFRHLDTNNSSNHKGHPYSFLSLVTTLWSSLGNREDYRAKLDCICVTECIQSITLL